MIYDHNRVTMKSSTEIDLVYGDYISTNYYHNARCIAKIERGEEPNIVEFKHKLIYSSFVIENLPDESDEKCGTRGMEGLDLRLESCQGRMIIKRNKKN